MFKLYNKFHDFTIIYFHFPQMPCLTCARRITGSTHPISINYAKSMELFLRWTFRVGHPTRLIYFSLLATNRNKGLNDFTLLSVSFLPPKCQARHRLKRRKREMAISGSFRLVSIKIQLHKFGIICGVVFSMDISGWPSNLADLFQPGFQVPD